MFHAGNRNEDIDFIRNQGLAVDDYNEPAPENVPQEQVTFSHLFDGQRWGFDGIDCRAATVPIDMAPCFQSGWSPKKKSLMDVFLKMTPYNFFKEVFIEKSSWLIVKDKMQPLGEGKFI